MKRAVKITAFACCVLLLGGVFFLAWERGQAGQRHTGAIFAMDTVVEQKVYGKNAQNAMDAVEQALYELEARLSLYKEGSDIAALNAAAGSGESVAVSAETWALLEKAKLLGEQSDGAFALTIAPLALAWGVTSEQPRVPDDGEIDALLALVGDESLILEEDGAARLARPGQAIDLGGIAKGEACEIAREIYDRYDIKAALCSMGASSIYARGEKPDGSAWRIGFRDPKADGSASLASFELRDAVFCTSGGYERFFEQDGVRYHHILDPATGRPAQSDIASVGVLCEDGAEADFWSTTLFIWGKERALAFFEAGGEGILLDEDNNIYVSGGLQASFRLADGAAGYNVVYLPAQADVMGRGERP